MTGTNETFETLNELGTEGYENLRKLGEMQMSNWNKLAEKQMEVFNLLLGSLVSQAELATDSKDYSEMLRGQVNLNQQLAEGLIEKTRESAEVVQQAGEEYRGWAEEVVKQATDKVSAATQKAA